MAKLIKISDTSAYRVSIIQMGDNSQKLLSLRKMYRTKKDPDNWQPAYQGMTIPLEEAERVLKAMSRVINDPNYKVEVIERESK